jgi:hypothetical protein
MRSTWLFVEELVFRRPLDRGGEPSGGGECDFFSPLVVARESHENGELNLRAIAGKGAGLLSEADGVGGVPLLGMERLETVESVALCFCDTLAMETWVGVRE